MSTTTIKRCTIHRETMDATLISEQGDEKMAEWIPTSQIIKIIRYPSGKADVTMTLLIAKIKGFA